MATTILNGALSNERPVLRANPFFTRHRSKRSLCDAVVRFRIPIIDPRSVDAYKKFKIDSADEAFAELELELGRIKNRQALVDFAWRFLRTVGLLMAGLGLATLVGGTVAAILLVWTGKEPAYWMADVYEGALAAFAIGLIWFEIIQCLIDWVVRPNAVKFKDQFVARCLQNPRIAWVSSPLREYRKIAKIPPGVQRLIQRLQNHCNGVEFTVIHTVPIATVFVGPEEWCKIEPDPFLVADGRGELFSFILKGWDEKGYAIPCTT